MDSSKINPIQGSQSLKAASAKKAHQKIDRRFSSFLDEALQTQSSSKEIKISGHAQKRLEERGLQLNQTDMENLADAVEELDQKGSKNSLLFYKDMALITSINNRTIITALNTDDMETITNIDSAMQIKE